MSVRYEERSTYVVDVPQPEGFEVLRPEQCVVRFSKGPTVDIGVLCFLKRAPEGRKRGVGTEGRKVDHSSRSATRVEQVRRLIANISDALRQTGARPVTIRDRYSRFIAFMGWADTAGWSAVLDDKVAARAAIQAYVAHLWDRVGRNEISVNSGVRQQSAMLAALQNYVEVEDLGRGLNLLRIEHSATQSTSPPDEAAQGRVLVLCKALFEGLAPLALDGAPYPYPLALPEYLNLPENRVWVFPTNSWFMVPGVEAKRYQTRRPRWGYNYKAGRVVTLDELRLVEGGTGNCDGGRRHAIRKAHERIRVANENPRHHFRCAAASLAMNLFIVQFQAQTGMNWAQVTELGWSDEYEVEASHQGFRTIKWRAGDKIVSFELPIAVMPAFRRYLNVRTFILEGKACELLFFSCGRYGMDTPTQIRSSGSHATYTMLRRLDPALPVITSREWRAAKSDWLVRNTDIATAALVLQNTEATVRRSYAEGSEITAMQEMGNFLDKVAATVLQPGAELEHSVERAVGKCANFGQPFPSHVAAAVKPDCRGAEGCLFCDNFKVHADEQDTRKLASCRHCIRMVGPSVGDAGRQALFTPIVVRIDALLAEISKLNAEMVHRVIREVDEEGELDAFWARKLEMLMELGLAA